MTIQPPTPEGKLVGYARVSREEQSAEMQIDAMLAAGLSRDLIYVDSASGRTLKRKGFMAVMKALRNGDMLVVWRLDRLSRNVHDMTGLIREFREREIGLFSLTDGVDITTPGGRFMATIQAAGAEYEVEVMSERTKAGQEAGRQRGYFPGRPASLSIDDKAAAVAELHAKPKDTTHRVWRIKVAKRWKISPATLSNYDKNARRAVTKSRREEPVRNARTRARERAKG